MKEKAAVIGGIGTTAPVVTELVKWLIEVKKEFVSDVVLFATRHQEVLKQAELVSAALKCSRWKLRTRVVELESEDLASEEEFYRFLKRAVGEIYKTKARYGIKRIFLNLSGGRKTMSVGFYLLSQFNPVTAAYLLISPQVVNFNLELERLKKEVEEFFNSSDLERYYQEHRAIFDPLLFPQCFEFVVIPVPIVPFPEGVLSDLHRVWKAESKVERSRLEHLSQNYLARALSQGLLEMDSTGKWVWTTHLGKNLLNILR
ncbi:MAG TPA: hypothetical protein EYP29_02190 [Thermoplasmata archaeon]|nr:hypothetical protein [Thermoplasmata archaeon]